MIKKLLNRFGYYHFSDNKFQRINKKLNENIMDYRSRFSSYPLKRTKLRNYLGKDVVATGVYVRIDENSIILKSVKIGARKVTHHVWMYKKDAELNNSFNGQIVEVRGKVYKYLSRKNPTFEEVSITNATIKPKEY